MFRIIIILLMAILTVLIIRRFKFVFTDHYFSLSDLLSTNSEDISIRGIILLISPIICGNLVLFFIGYTAMESVIYGFGVAFLLIWPMFLYPYSLINYEAYRRKKTLYFLYALYMMFLMGLSFYVNHVASSIALSETSVNRIYNSLLDQYIVIHPLYQDIIGAILGTVVLAIIFRGIKRAISLISQGDEGY